MLVVFQIYSFPCFYYICIVLFYVILLCNLPRVKSSTWPINDSGRFVAERGSFCVVFKAPTARQHYNPSPVCIWWCAETVVLKMELKNIFYHLSSIHLNTLNCILDARHIARLLQIHRSKSRLVVSYQERLTFPFDGKYFIWDNCVSI